MGRAKSPKPVRLAEKLLQIRTRLNLSQNELIRRMGLEEELTQAEVSAFERGIRVPPLPVLLQYARAAGGGSHLEALIDDRLDLPDKLPSALVREVKVTRKSPAPGRKR
jgi:transcriptional regulator with XRE-family HTH domain